MTVMMPVDNARTMDFHYIENTGNEDLVFLEMFAAPELVDVSLNQWMRSFRN